MSVEFDHEIIAISSIFNPKVHSAVLPIIEDIKWNSDLGRALFTGEDKINPDCSLSVLRSVVAQFMIPGEVEAFIEQVESMKTVTDPSEIRILIDGVFGYYKNREVHDVISKNASNIDSIIEGIRSIPQALVGNINPVVLGELNASDIVNEELGGMDRVLPTNLKIVSEATPFHGYLPGQVVMWLGAPGRGKSAMMLYEVTRIVMDGYKVLWVAMGDLTKYDFITRFTAVLTGSDYYKVAVNPTKYWTPEVQELANSITLITVPAGRITPDELRNFVELSDADYDLVVVDYDSNFKEGSDNMYKAGGDIYNVLTEIARPDHGKARVVFSASQPKVHLWEALEIPESGAGESSRKQHIIDMMITMGTANLDKPAGIINMAKVRRGKAGGKVGYHMDGSGRFHEVSREQLALMMKY